MVKVLEQNEVSTLQSDSYLRNRESERSLLLQLYQLASASHLPIMQHSQRLDQRLHMLREEVRTMTQEKERGEWIWRDRLQRCQRQLKAKEEEMSRQSQYFENFKAQLQHKLSLARDREQSLQNRIYTLEKQLLDMTVTAATGMATISAVRITAGTVTHREEQERLLSMRGEGEGEEERKEERRRQWQPSMGIEREGGREGDEGKTEKEIQGGRVKDTKQNSNEARLQGFILSLQEDLRVLLEREEDGMTEQRGLMEQLQKAQENSHFLGCKVEEMKAEVHLLKLSESSLIKEVEELREENHSLQQILGDAANQTPSQSSTVPESTCPGPGTSSPSCSPAAYPVPSHTTAMGHSSVGSLGEVYLTSNEEIGQPHSSAVPPVHHQATAESTQNNTEEHSLSAKSETPPKNYPLNLFRHLGSKTNPSLQFLSLSTETLDEFKLGAWCSRRILNLEVSPSEESDALREAYRSLGLGEDLEALQEQRDRLEVALQHTQGQLQMMAQENTQLKLQLSKEAEEQEAEAEQGLSREKISILPTSDGKDDLVQALNRENRALVDRIQELLAHIELREEEIKREETQLREHISKLEADGVRLEQENQEQGCLITELTKKTEDDLNTIMELQHRLEESEQHMEESQVDKELCGSQLQSEYAAAISGSCQQNNLKECVDGLVKSVLKGEEPQLMSSQQPDDSTTASAPGFQHNNHYDPLQNSLQSSLHVISLTDQVGQLTKSVQSLKTEQEELSVDINSLREQQREVALLVQTQTEVKQQLTRTVWGLKEEKDSLSQSLAGLKQEREQLTRTVCGLKDERDQFVRSMSSLKEEKGQLTESLSALEGEKEKLLESLSSGKEERDQIMQSLQSLQTESDQLSQAVLYLKQERDELSNSLKCLKEQRDKEQPSYTLHEDRGKLIKSVSSLREEKERTEHSISCLKQDEKQIKLLLQGLREERDSLKTALPSQTQTEGRNQNWHLLNPNSAVTTKKTETLVGLGEYATQRCQTDDHRGNSLQEQSDLMRETEALGAELKRSQNELDKSHAYTKMLHSELCQSEARREEAERKAAQAADEVMRVTDVANQMEETKKENDSLITQVKELQSKLAGLVTEKTDALSLKAEIDEQYNILTAQLKAKTVALEELNSEYIALKGGQGSKEDLSTVLVSLRTRYNDIRAKYDALLKKRSQKDLDIAPLKAKLSCLVLKCQERNSLLVQMMKAMHRRGCVDSTLTQQVEQLLSDAALQDYAAAFTPGSNVKTRDYSTGFTPRFISKFHDYTNGFTHDQTCSSIPPLVNQQYQNGLTSESGVKSEKHTSLVTTEFTTNRQDCSSKVTSAPTGTLKKNANSPVQRHASVQVTPSPVVRSLKESLITNTAQLSPSASGPVQATSGPEKLGLHHPDMKGKSFPDPASSTGSSLSPAPPSSSTRVSRSRRLSSPEKIINLHEQLQKTLMSSYQAPVSRGRGQQPRKSLSCSAPADLKPASQTKTQSLSFDTPHTNSLPVTTDSSPAKHTPAVTTTPVATNKSTTLFNAVASRSANVTFSPNMFTNHHFKADISKTTASALSSSSDFTFATMAPGKSTSSSAANVTISPKLTKKTTANPDVSDAKHTASTPLTLRTTTFDSDVLICSDTNPKTTASDTTAPSISTAPEANHFNMPSKMDGAAPAYDGLVFAASCTQSAHRSPERSNKSARKSTAALEKTKTARPKPALQALLCTSKIDRSFFVRSPLEAPAEVRSVEVIKTVGQSSLMIGWERPPLDELGCSNGTFVYGYRVFVDGDFHKSVMSSACTKCILENVDLRVPVHISVQTLGSNGLSSNSVHTMYRTSVRTDHHTSVS
ncbi:trichohyalin-like [Siniperca chuatsi]|uniref:trichohyalin-like n=1 Tax=Siniperca chuatsi TaxID=119488 RepID=UPI001CE1ECD2|nr:trichohyalin-like [Siniperca chuatsi]